MKHLKMLALASLTAAAVLGASGTASATTLTSPAGTTLVKGSMIKAQSEGHTVLDSVIGKIECSVGGEGELTDAGSATETTEGEVFFGTFSCTSAAVTVVKTGTAELHSLGSGKGTLTGSGTEVTVQTFGLHCIFTTNATTLGTVTGGTPATLQISATIPRTGGSSGAFCGASAPYTGKIKVTSPGTLLID